MKLQDKLKKIMQADKLAFLHTTDAIELDAVSDKLQSPKQWLNLLQTEDGMQDFRANSPSDEYVVNTAISLDPHEKVVYKIAADNAEELIVKLAHAQHYSDMCYEAWMADECVMEDVWRELYVSVPAIIKTMQNFNVWLAASEQVLRNMVKNMSAPLREYTMTIKTPSNVKNSKHILHTVTYIAPDFKGALQVAATQFTHSWSVVRVRSELYTPPQRNEG